MGRGAFCAERALELGVDTPEGAWWNLGIAATALRDWNTARAAWRAAGLKVPPGEGPLEMDLGRTPVRLRGQRPEVVWCTRINPVRAMVCDVPTAESGRRYGDLVIHDGAPNGLRVVDGRDYDVFDELALLQASSFHTYSVEILVRTPKDIDDLLVACETAEMAAEDWTSSVRHLCKACSEGTPSEKHAHEHEPPAWTPQRKVGVATKNPLRLVRVLRSWARGVDRDFFAPECAVEGVREA